MLNIRKKTLSNGLRVVVHEDHTTPLAACNIVYNVGSRDEHPDHTGFAHLMEHFMFTGSRNVPDFDKVLQKVGAINNAYTSQDITHYYEVLPANNLETALWIESDRMLELAFRQESLDIQKQVVIEEFKENYLNRPYGDLMMLFNQMAYERHPYQWLPIGKKTEHIAEVNMAMIKDFYYRFYRPNNAVLVVAGNVHYDKVIELVEKWFGDIPAGTPVCKEYPRELPQTAARIQIVERPVPSDVLMKGWHMCDRMHPDYYACDLLSDMFGTGQSSYLYQHFVTEKKLFTDISASIMGTTDEGLFLISGRPVEGVSIEDADAALCSYLYGFMPDKNFTHDLLKVQNRAEAVLLNNEIKIDDRATNMAVGETISNVEYFLDERQHYFDVTEEQMLRLISEMLTENKSNTLYYKMLKQ
ncbi:MAG: insulinase family protein [Bacteroidales bacterium]|nr:insulinase family protein [Bacteroidales bacterium]